MSKPSDVEIRANEFVRDNKDLLERASLGPLTLQTIARAGSLISVELCDEVVQAAHAYEDALHEGAESVAPGEAKDLNPKRVAAVEARIPTLKATYERKARAFDELSKITERAIQRYEAAEEQSMDVDFSNSQPVTPLRVVRPWWKRMFG